jgi:hypothetical protein
MTAWNQLLKNVVTTARSPLRPQMVVRTLSDLLPDNAVISLDCGANTHFAARRPFPERRSIRSLTGSNQELRQCQRKRVRGSAKTKAASMAGRRECQGALPPRLIKESSATSAGRNNRGIKNERSKSAAKTRGTIPRARSANPMRLWGSSRAVPTRTTPAS